MRSGKEQDGTSASYTTEPRRARAIRNSEQDSQSESIVPKDLKDHLLRLAPDAC